MFPFPISTCQISSHLQYLSLPHNSKCSSGSLAPKPINHLKRLAELEDDLAKSQRVQESKRKYETTRKRLYKYSWEKGRPWLCYSVSKMWCAACSAAGLSNVFTSGVSTMKSFRRMSYQKHTSDLWQNSTLGARVCSRRRLHRRPLFCLNTRRLYKLGLHFEAHMPLQNISCHLHYTQFCVSWTKHTIHHHYYLKAVITFWHHSSYQTKL